MNVHLHAIAHQDHIVFLHTVNEGPASQSYGLQVAQLAGVPRGVIQRAREKLAELENKTMLTPASSQVRPRQMDFLQTEKTSQILALLDTIEPDTFTPMAALEMLYTLKQASESN